MANTYSVENTPDTINLPVYYRGKDKPNKLRMFHVPCPIHLTKEDIEGCRNQLIGELNYLKEDYLKPVLAVIKGGKA